MRITRPYKTKDLILVIGIIVAIIIGITTYWYNFPTNDASISQPNNTPETTTMIKTATEFLLEKGQSILKQTKEIL